MCLPWVTAHMNNVPGSIFVGTEYACAGSLSKRTLGLIFITSTTIPDSITAHYSHGTTPVCLRALRFRSSKSLFDANLSAAVDVDKLDLPGFVVACVELAAQCSAVSGPTLSGQPLLG